MIDNCRGESRGVPPAADPVDRTGLLESTRYSGRAGLATRWVLPAMGGGRHENRQPVRGARVRVVVAGD